jgi:hypothetical protein
MVNPMLTVLFNLFLVGSAVAIIAAMVQEYFDSRTPSVGGKRPALPVSAASGTTSLQVRQRRAMRKAA